MEEIYFEVNLKQVVTVGVNQFYFFISTFYFLKFLFCCFVLRVSH